MTLQQLDLYRKHQIAIKAAKEALNNIEEAYWNLQKIVVCDHKGPTGEDLVREVVHPQWGSGWFCSNCGEGN